MAVEKKKKKKNVLKSWFDGDMLLSPFLSRQMGLIALIAALIIFPALSAMRIAKSYRGVIITSAALSIICSLVGIFGSLWLETPVGAGIVAINIASFGICSLVGYICRRVGAR